VDHRGGRDDTAAAIVDGAIRVGGDAGLPLHHSRWTERPTRTRRSSRAVGNVLIDLVSD